MVARDGSIVFPYLYPLQMMRRAMYAWRSSIPVIALVLCGTIAGAQERTVGATASAVTVIRLSMLQEDSGVTLSQTAERKSPGLAGLLSVILPGAGQFYNGQAGKGFLMLAAWGGSVAIALTAGLETDEASLSSGGTGTNGAFWGGLAAALVVEVWSVVDAVNTANRLNRQASAMSGAHAAPLLGVRTGPSGSYVAAGLRMSF